LVCDWEGEKSMKNILIIQTAFLGDVVLATGLIEKLQAYYPAAKLDFLLQQGNESLIKNHPKLNRVFTWNKKQNKYKNLLQLLGQIRQSQYDLIINLQRFGSTGLLTALSGAKQTVGFDKNPFSRFFTRRYRHDVKSGQHEIARNHLLIASITDEWPAKPCLYPAAEDYIKVQPYKTQSFICLAPTSVWFTKQYPAEKWVHLLDELPAEYKVYLLGSPADKELAEELKKATKNKDVVNLCGQLSLLQSAALMQDAQLNYVNDSGPMHLASALNAPTCAVYCSTVPSFGFGPLADFAQVVQKTEPLYCRPCGLHGYRKCPEGHFKCAHDIQTRQLLEVLALTQSVS